MPEGRWQPEGGSEPAAVSRSGKGGARSEEQRTAASGRGRWRRLGVARPRSVGGGGRRAWDWWGVARQKTRPRACQGTPPRTPWQPAGALASLPPLRRFPLRHRVRRPLPHPHLKHAQPLPSPPTAHVSSRTAPPTRRPAQQSPRIAPSLALPSRPPGAPIPPVTRSSTGGRRGGAGGRCRRRRRSSPAGPHTRPRSVAVRTLRPPQAAQTASRARERQKGNRPFT